MRFATLLVCGLAFAGTPAGPGLDVVTPAGLDFRHANSPTSHKHLIEAMGGGVALLDYDNDGRLDIFFVNGGQLTEARPAGPPQFARSNPKYRNRFYHQNRDGGFTDLYVTSFGRNILYRNTGQGSFADVTARAGVAAGGWSASAGFFDFDNDGRLDLFVTRYMGWSLATSRACGDSVRV